MMNITLDEIATARSAMMGTDEALGKPAREYTDEEVKASLVEIIPDSGGTLLGFFRASKMVAELLGPNARAVTPGATEPPFKKQLES